AQRPGGRLRHPSADLERLAGYRRLATGISASRPPGTGFAANAYSIPPPGWRAQAQTPLLQEREHREDGGDGQGFRVDGARLASHLRRLGGVSNALGSLVQIALTARRELHSRLVACLNESQ